MKMQAFLSIMIMMTILLSCSESNNQIEKSIEPFTVVEEMPVFPGGDNALFKLIAESVNYPDSAIKSGIQGRVIIRFAVESDGRVSRVSIYEGANPLLDEEALRVVKALPYFKPGKQGGIAVPVWYNVPIKFTLR